MLYHSDLIKGLQEKGEHARIGELPLQEILSTDINEPLGPLLERMQGSPAQMIYVTDAGQTVGLLNLEHLLELIRIQQAVEAHQISKNH